MSDQYKRTDNKSKPLRLTEPAVKWTIDNELVNAVITAAVWSSGQQSGVWQKMIQALNQGADKTWEGTVNAFLFRAMVDRLLEEFHALGHDKEDKNSASTS